MVEKKGRLARTLNAWDGTSIIIANVIGIGIFTTPGIVVGMINDISAFLSLWIAGGFLAMIGAVAYADLASFIPKAGGEYIYLKKAFGPVWGFLSGWTSFVAGFSGAIAASSVGFAEYIQVFLPDPYTVNEGMNAGFYLFQVHIGHEKIIAITVILFITLFHTANISVGSRFQNYLTLLNITTILALIGFGFTSGPDWIFKEQNSSGNVEISGWFLALIPVMFTYSGWNAAVYVAEEIKNPEKNMHRSLVAGTATVLFLYLLINLLIVGTIPFESLTGSIDVINIMSNILFGPSGMMLFSIVILTALLSSISAMIITGPRIYFAMARDKLFPSIFGSVHPEKRVPRKSIWLQSGWAIILVLSGTFEQLLIYTGFSIILFSGLSVFALLLFNKKFRKPSLSPAKKILYSLFAFTCFAMVINALVMSPLPSIAGLVLIIAGLPVFYWYSRARKITPI